MRTHIPFAALTVSVLILTSCGSRVDRLQAGSPLAVVVGVHAPDRDQRVRHAVLRQLPIGSSRLQIEAFIRQNFAGVAYRVTTTDDSRAFIQLTAPHVLIRALDITGFPGEDRVEIYLVLAPGERLKDVIVRSHEAYV